jgi:zinc transporter 2
MEMSKSDHQKPLLRADDKSTTFFTSSVNGNTDIEENPVLIEEIQPDNSTLRKLWIVSGICLVFMIIEIIGGYLASSIAIMADAAHLLSDLLGFLISIASIYISRKQATSHMSYGYHRAEVIGALVSVNIIWGLTMWLLYEATLRLVDRRPVNGFIMVITAIIGFVFNVVMGVILAYQGIDHYLHHHHDHEHEENDHELHDHKHSHSHGHEHKHGHKLSDHSHNNKKQHSDKKKIGVIAEENEYEPLHEHDDKHEHGHDDKHNHDDHHTHDQEPEHKHDHSEHHKQEHKLKRNNSKLSHEEINKEHSHDRDHEHNDNQTGKHSHGHHHGDVNLRAALIHVIGDAIQNLGVVIAGIIIYIWPEYSIADPICTFIFSIIIIFTTTRIIKDCISVLMEGSPVELNIDQLTKDLLKVKGVMEIHDLHVWSLSVGKLSLSCHLISNNPQISLSKATKLIRDKYGITHSTIQVEVNDKELHDCTHDLH